jgi:hypothetical protein
MVEKVSSIDHIMWVAPTLETGCEEFEELTGVRPEFGGRHPGFGTHNALASLSNNRYIEVLALDPEQTTDNPIAKQIGEYRKTAIFAFHVHRQELEEVAQVYNEAGVVCQGPIQLERQRPDGEVLRWRLLFPDFSIFGRALPIFIDWMDAPHPAKTAPVGCEMTHFEVAHPQCEQLKMLYEKLDVEIATLDSDKSVARAKLSTPKGEVTLSGAL